MKRRTPDTGFTLLEVMVVIGILGVLAALAVPRMDDFFEDQRLKTSARRVADALKVARAEAIRTGNNHLVFFGADTSLSPVTTPDGRAAVLVFDDGAPGANDCSPASTETQYWFPVEDGVQLGNQNASTPHPLDTGDTSAMGSGSTFVQPTGGSPAAFWVALGPDGVPVGVTAACAFGGTGTGGGAIYVENDRRDYAIVLTPLGGVRVSAWEQEVGQWQ